MEYEFEGYIYQFKKLGLSSAKECLAKLTEIGFFEHGLEALTGNADALNDLERRLFREHISLLNDQDDWVPLGKELTENHFTGRLGAYFNLLVKAIKFQFEDFLSDGWTTGLNAAVGDE